MPTPQELALQAQQLNLAARSLVIASGVERVQQIFSSTFNPASANLVNVNPRLVGLIKGFWVKVTATVNNGSGNAITPTDFNIMNTLSQITFTDLQNNVRIQTTGWHLNAINSIKARRIYGSASTNASQDCPIGYGANWAVDSATASIANGGTGTITKWYYVPLAYSDTDLRGAIYAGVINATMQLGLTVNPTPGVNTASDSTLAIYLGTTGATSVTLNPVTITVYQHYMDQLPVGQNGLILPQIDLSTIYELKNTIVNSMVANQDFPVQYSNFRDFLSTIPVYYNGTARVVGADVSYWALQSANLTNLWKEEPNLAALRTRNHLGFDLPKGMYYFGSRDKPISTVQYGNMELILNAITAGAGAYMLIGYEDFAILNTVTGAGSLAAS